MNFFSIFSQFAKRKKALQTSLVARTVFIKTITLLVNIEFHRFPSKKDTAKLGTSRNVPIQFLEKQQQWLKCISTDWYRITRVNNLNFCWRGICLQGGNGPSTGTLIEHCVLVTYRNIEGMYSEWEEWLIRSNAVQSHCSARVHLKKRVIQVCIERVCLSASSNIGLTSVTQCFYKTLCPCFTDLV